VNFKKSFYRNVRYITSCLGSGFGGIPSYRRYVITRARSFERMNLRGDNEVWVEIVNDFN